MDIFYPEYAAIIVFLAISVWRILKNAPPEKGKRRSQKTNRARIFGSDKK